MVLWSPDLQRAFLSLAPHAVAAAPICRAAADGRFGGATRLPDICAVAGIAEARISAVEAALAAGASCGLFERCGGMEWRPQTIPFAELATALEAVALYRERIHVDADRVEVVLTPPGKRSQLGEALRMRGRVEGDLEHTEAILRHLAAQATTRFAVLSPFIDSWGMDSLVAMFRATKGGVTRVLVTRCQEGVVPPPLQLAFPTLNSLGVGVHNYWLPRQGGYETFHAKVILADDRMAYIGSANMTQASLSVSMELGALLEGTSAKTLVSVVEAILSIAPRLN